MIGITSGHMCLHFLSFDRFINKTSYKRFPFLMSNSNTTNKRRSFSIVSKPQGRLSTKSSPRDGLITAFFENFSNASHSS